MVSVTGGCQKRDIINKILQQLEANPRNRRSMFIYGIEALKKQTAPVCFQTMFDVRRVDGDIYLDATPNSRVMMLVAHHINAMQYVALQMMIAKHFGWR